MDGINDCGNSPPDIEMPLSHDENETPNFIDAEKSDENMDWEMDESNPNETLAYSDDLYRNNVESPPNQAPQNAEIKTASQQDHVGEGDTEWTIPSDVRTYVSKDFKKGNPIGEGVYGKVYKITFKTDDSIQFAFKKFNKLKEGSKSISREIRGLLAAEHDNIIKFVGVYSENDTISGVIMELMDYSVHTAFNKYIIATEPRLSWCLQASKAIAFLHGINIIHRDLKPANMLLSQNKTLLKICDFGLARIIPKNGKMTKGQGTPDYQAPEIDRDRDDYGTPVDVFSMGVSAREIHTRGFRTENTRKIEDTDVLDLLERATDKVESNRPHIDEFVQLFTKKHSDELHLLSQLSG